MGRAEASRMEETVSHQSLTLDGLEYQAKSRYSLQTSYLEGRL